MVKLSEFVGEVVSELAQARQTADSASVQLSQIYHADSLLKEMPVPHYTIDEAEISFPLSIVSVLSGADNNLEKSILNAIKLKLPTVLYQSMKQCYLDKKREKQIKQQEENEARQNTTTDITESTPADDVVVEMGKGIEKLYGQIANRISLNIGEKMKEYLSVANMTLIKPLDIKDMFMDYLQKEYVIEFSNQDVEKHPVADNDALARMIRTVGTNIFFEFIDFANEKGILVDACTGRLCEYNTKDNIMNIKLKVKEQDLDFVVTGEDKNGNAKRFLSLN